MTNNYWLPAVTCSPVDMQIITESQKQCPNIVNDVQV